jgi:hypothetical protein
VRAAIDSPFSPFPTPSIFVLGTLAGVDAEGRCQFTVSCNAETWAESEEMADSVADSREDKARYIGCRLQSFSLPAEVTSLALIVSSGYGPLGQVQSSRD